MKIEQLRFRNLNSLAGEWVIDFTDRELSDEGIFLITGPTGAGKTTILDAITLALYGQTPRLSSISTGGNEIMSRQQVNCFSEVIFSAGGKRYRALWSQRRARGKADGRLQAPYREFEDMTGAPGKPIDKIREVSRAVLEAVGMDFDGFTRSVMLTQGQFARFLNAQPADRAHILEKNYGYGLLLSHFPALPQNERRSREKIRALTPAARRLPGAQQRGKGSARSRAEGH